MKCAIRIACLLGITLVLLGAFIVARPFNLANDVLDRVFGIAPKWTQVTKLRIDPATQELSRGEHPHKSFAILEENWAPAGSPRVVFIGNSQMFAVSLAPGELPLTSLEKAWVDLLGDHGMRVYRLSAPGMSYIEALWYVHYLLSHPGLKPDAIVLQLNYQSFWNGGIRKGMLELLSDQVFLADIERESSSGAAYAETFEAALRDWKMQEMFTASPGAGAKNQFPGDALENSFREWARPMLARISGQKGSFFDLLYASRVYLLRLDPTTARSITGTRWLLSRAAVEKIAGLCRERRIRLVLYNAPVNPRVNLYRRPEDRQSYLTFLHFIEANYQVPVYDLEASISEQYWGFWMNGPDPLHLGRAGHARMASLMDKVIEEELARRGD